MQFRNPVNGYVETASAPAFWCLLFGPLYFLSKAVVFHAAMSFVAALMTFGLSWFIYPFFAGSAVRSAYMRAGWTEVKRETEHRKYDPTIVRRTSHAA